MPASGQSATDAGRLRLRMLAVGSLVRIPTAGIVVALRILFARAREVQPPAPSH